MNYRLKKIAFIRVDSRLKAKMVNAIIIPTISYVLPFINNNNELKAWDLQIKKNVKQIIKICRRSSTALL